MLPPTLVPKKFPNQNDMLITFYHNSETPCSSTIYLFSRVILKRVAGSGYESNHRLSKRA